MKPDLWEACCRWAGIGLSLEQGVSLRRYRDWLLDEAIQAGGLGPNERERVDERHVGDSLLFAGGFAMSPAEVLDVGSGVGLPGIPLAIVLPDTHFYLLDRSRRRVDLMKRALRVLELPNAEVIDSDISDWERPVDGIVSRGSLSPDQALVGFKRLLKPGGTAIVGGSWARKPQVDGFEPLEIPASVLDQKVWLLIMRQQ